MWIFTGGHSFRGAKDSELIAFGKTTFEMNMKFFSEEREQDAKNQHDEREKKCYNK